MKADSRKSSQNLARALSSMVAHAPQLQPSEVVAGLDEIEATFLPKVASSKKEQLETKRRVAEWKFKLLSERNLPFEQVEKFYRAVHELGFTNIETEGTIEIYYAQYCERQSRRDEAKRTLEQLRAKLSKALAKRKLAAYRQLMQEVEELLSKLSSK
jgi:tRNA U34 5-carboxymethylaminomethyl modifying enzyme MnmG/GidA